MKILLSYLIIINFLSFIIMFIDKNKAIKHKYRISENTLVSLSLIGGSIGMLTGMHIFRHKTKKPKFKFGIPLILFIQLVFAIFIV